jgi:hypothetical protein
MSDPLRWWPGKSSECRSIAALVEDRLPAGSVLQYGGLPVFAELLPDHRVCHAPLQQHPDAHHGAQHGAHHGDLWLPYPDDHFDVGVSARVIELLPPALRTSYLHELLRVCRAAIYIAVPQQPELAAIDRVKNAYVWDTHRIWPHHGVQADEIEACLAGRDVCIDLHAEPACATWVSATDARGAYALPPTTTSLDAVTPPFMIAEVLKSIRLLSCALSSAVQ